MNPNRTYCIVNYADVTDDMVAASSIKSKDSLRRSVSGDDRVIMSWDGGSTPSFFDSYTTYTHSQMRAIVSDEREGWYEEQEIPEIPE